MDRLRHLIVGSFVGGALLGGALVAGGCSKDPNAPRPDEASLPRTAVVTGESDPNALKTFCDKSWPGEGAVQPWGGGPAKKPAVSPSAAVAAPPAVEGKAKGWRWVSFWATWCAPCLEEMPMLGKWRDAFQKEGVPFDLELWSVDEDEAKLRDKVRQGLPAPVTWVESPEALAAYLGKIGRDPDSMLPVQMLIDPKDQLRCVRVGSVHDNDWGTVRKLIR